MPERPGASLALMALLYGRLAFYWVADLAESLGEGALQSKS